MHIGTQDNARNSRLVRLATSTASVVGGKSIDLAVGLSTGFLMVDVKAYGRPGDVRLDQRGALLVGLRRR